MSFELPSAETPETFGEIGGVESLRKYLREIDGAELAYKERLEKGIEEGKVSY